VTVAAGVDVYYCLRVENTGNVAFESISVTDNALGITNLVVTFQQPLPPGASIPLPSTVITGFGPVAVTEDTVNTVEYTLTAIEGSTVNGTASATVTVVAPAPDANVQKTVGAIPGCSDSSELSIATGLDVYYCLVVENSGNVPFDTLVFTDTTLSVTNEVITFPQPLPPQGTISFTRAAVPEFGPVTVFTDTINTIEYQLIGVEGSTVNGTASATVTTGPAEPSAVVTKTVGTTPGCSDTSDATVVAGTNAYYCLRIENTGNVPFASVTITDTNLGMTNQVISFSAPIPPSVAAPLPSTAVPQFGPVLITEDTVNTLDYKLTGTEGSTTSGTASATVTTIPAEPSAVVTKTVGTAPGCASTSEITVIAGTNVFYCLSVANTGNVSFGSVAITDDALGISNLVVTFPVPVPPSTSIPLPSGVVTGFGPVVINEATVNTLEYVLTAVEGSTIQGTASATVNVEDFDPGAVVTKTVGTTPGCASTSEITVDPGALVFYCLTVENTGNVPFTSISITDPNVDLSNELFPFPVPLPPGASIPLPSAVVTGFGPVVINETTVNTLEYALAGTDGSTVEGTASATVNMTPISIELEKTVGTTANQCATTSTITVPAGTTVFYCYTITNTGEFTLTLHNLQDSELGAIHSNLELELAPGASDSSTIESDTITTNTTNTATWTAFVELDGASTSATDTATVNVEGAEGEDISLPIIRVGSQ
jgi:hypothetical protein